MVVGCYSCCAPTNSIGSYKNSRAGGFFEGASAPSNTPTARGRYRSLIPYKNTRAGGLFEGASAPSKKLTGRGCYRPLIPYNNTRAGGFFQGASTPSKKTDGQRVLSFLNVLMKIRGQEVFLTAGERLEKNRQSESVIAP